MLSNVDQQRSENDAMLNKLIDTMRKRRARQRSIAAMCASEQREQGVVNVYRNDQSNVGDWYCALHHDFPKLKAEPLDAYAYQSPDRAKSDTWVGQISRNALIVGGGGILNRGSFDRQLKLFEELAGNGKTVILWGAGYNDKVLRGAGAVKSYNIDTTAFSLAGVRDYGHSEAWVPCSVSAACMSPYNYRQLPLHVLGHALGQAAWPPSSCYS